MSQIFHRQRWKSHTFPDTEHLLRDEFRLFRAEFEKNFSRVPDATSEEAYRLLISMLPISWRKKVLEEEENLGREQFWVKIEKFGEFSKDELEEFLTYHAGEFPKELREKERGCFLVRFAT